MQDVQTQVWVEPSFQDIEVRHGHHVRIERQFIPGHFETRCEKSVVSPGHYEDLPRQELVSEGHWQITDKQVVLSPGHYETRTERVLVRDGRWEDRPLLRIDRDANLGETRSSNPETRIKIEANSNVQNPNDRIG